MAQPDREERTVPPDGRSYDEQPQWRQDFPIDTPQDYYVARRDFTKFIALTSFAFVIGQFWIVLQNIFRKRKGEPQMRQIATVDQIPVGGDNDLQLSGRARRMSAVAARGARFCSLQPEMHSPILCSSAGGRQ